MLDIGVLQGLQGLQGADDGFAGFRVAGEGGHEGGTQVGPIGRRVKLSGDGRGCGDLGEGRGFGAGFPGAIACVGVLLAHSGVIVA